MTGLSLEDNYEGAECFNRDVIRAIDNPLKPAGSQIAVLHGNLAPNGAVIKQAAASPELMQHVGRARVWDRVEDYLVEADDPDCDIDPYDIIVIRYSGPRGYPGMPEIANVALPKKLLQQGVRDMVRISDARMSGTSYGTVVLHVTPRLRSAGRWPWCATATSSCSTCPAAGSSCRSMPTSSERRRAEWTAPAVEGTDRGYLKLYVDHVMGADEGADFDFLRGGSGAAVPRQAF